MKYGKSPPDGGDNQETLEASGPLWQAVARLIDDEESAHEMHCQLERAMVTRGLAEALSQPSPPSETLVAADQLPAAEILAGELVSARLCRVIHGCTL